MGSADGRRRRRFLKTALSLLIVLGALAPAIVAASQETQGPADPAAVDRDVRDVMSRREYSYEPSIIDRIGAWISDFLDNLFPDSSPSGGTFAGGVGPLVAWAIIAAAVVAAVVVVVLVVSRRVAWFLAVETPSSAEVEHRRRAEEWLADADRLEAEGRWKDVVRARYRGLVRTLVDRRQLPDVPGRTTGELRADLGRTTSSAGEQFDTCSLLFELAWYADVPTGPDEQQRFRDAASQVLAQVPEDRFDPVMLLDVAGGSREPRRSTEVIQAGRVQVGPDRTEGGT